MRQNELNRPVPVFVPPHGRTAVLEVVMLVEPSTSLPPGDLEELLEEITRRVDRALAGIFDALPVDARVDDISVVNPRHVPFFPATFGDKVYFDQTEVYEQLAALRQGTPLEGCLYDCAGRAFTPVVWASFRREKDHDQPVHRLWTLAPDP